MVSFRLTFCNVTFQIQMLFFTHKQGHKMAKVPVILLLFNVIVTSKSIQRIHTKNNIFSVESPNINYEFISALALLKTKTLVILLLRHNPTICRKLVLSLTQLRSQYMHDQNSHRSYNLVSEKSFCSPRVLNCAIDQCVSL